MTNGLSKEAVEKLREILVNERYACNKDAMAHVACSPRYNELLNRAHRLKEGIALLDAAIAEAEPVNATGLTEEEKCALWFFPTGCTCSNMTAYDCPFHLAVKALTA